MKAPLTLKEQREKAKIEKLKNRIHKHDKKMKLGGTKKQRNAITSARGERIVNGRVHVRPINVEELKRITELSYTDGNGIYDLVSTHRDVLGIDTTAKEILSEEAYNKVNGYSEKITAACERFKGELTEHYQKAKDTIEQMGDAPTEDVLTGVNIAVVLPLGDMFQIWGMEVMDTYTDLMTAINGDI